MRPVERVLAGMERASQRMDGWPMSLDEIAEASGYTNRSSVVGLVRELVQQGKVETRNRKGFRLPRVAR